MVLRCLFKLESPFTVHLGGLKARLVAKVKPVFLKVAGHIFSRDAIHIHHLQDHFGDSILHVLQAHSHWYQLTELADPPLKFVSETQILFQNRSGVMS